MKKPTILKFGLMSLIFLQSIISYSQNLVSNVDRTDQALRTEKFLMGSFASNEQFGTYTNNETNKPSSTAAALTNPVIPYAELPYAGQVVKCPNDGKLLPKLFLCGGNDSRTIDTKITDARSIIWERFISGGSCVTVSNSDCANDNASDACWVKVGDKSAYIANSAGQFRIKIIDNAGNPSTFYFNVYQNTLIPTAITKSDIIKNASGTCQIPGQIKVGGFGSGYEYSFTTTGAPGAWDVNNTFTTSTPGNYTAFIRIKGVVGSCEFKVLNQDVKSITLAVSTEVISPRCYNGKGSIKVIKNDNSKAYTFNVYKPASSTTRLAFYDVEAGKELEYTFKDLDPGTYRVETVIQETNCVIDNKPAVIIPNPPADLTMTLKTTALGVCSSGSITVTAGGGTTPYRYLVDIDDAGFVQNGNNVITTVRPGIYTIRIIDANGCSIDKKTTVADIDKPIYTITKTDGDCTNPKGIITINVTDVNGYTIESSINGGSYSAVSVTGNVATKQYPGLDPENYIISVRYKKSGVNSGKNCTDPDFPIAIGLTTALTASVGVAELSGCGPVGNVKQGKVRITNAEGGVPLTGPNGPYLYSYDDRKTWVTDKEMYVDPGTHIFYIKDQKCEIPLNAITLLNQPTPPTISVADPVFNCDGSATTTVTVLNSGSPTTQFTYDYFIDGVLNTNSPTNIFKNVTQGDHTISVSYNVLNVPTESVLLNETFGSGPDVSSPGINPNFCWERQVEATKCNNDLRFGNGEYTVTNFLKNNPYSGWWSPKDNTSKGKNTSGRFLAVDAGNAIPNNAVLYRKTINDIIPNVPIKVTFVATNLLIKTNTQPDASLTVELQNGSGVALSSQSTGKIPKTEGWVPYTRIIDPGNNTSLDFVLRLELSQVNGIDFAVDDLVVTQMPKACNTVANFPIFVDGSKAFSAGITGYKDVKCSGEQNGEITLSAKNFDETKGFQYLVTGDPAGWQTVIPVPAATSGSITLKNLASKIYNISIRYDDKAGSCVFPVAQEIKSPKKLKVDAWVDQVLKCFGGANIKAKATDGTPGYLYELRETDGVTVVKAFQDSDTFLDIKITGNYKVVAKDLNDCQTEVLASVDIVAPVKPKLDIVPSSVCFDKNTGTNITIKVTDGVPDYTYTVKYNGGTPSGASATFTGPNFTYKALNEGSYEFIVTDSFGCSSDPITQVITAQLLAATPVTSPLDCDPAPANLAVITGTIEGGKAPFAVTITTGDKSGVLVPPSITGNTFTYTTAVSGDYTFTIKDANNCTTTSDAKINALVPITLSSTDVNPKCSGSSDGTILLKPGGGTGKFTYSRDGIFYDDTSYYTGLSAGVEYTYYVKDENKCTKSIKITLVAPDPISGTATITTPYTCVDPATITVGAVVTGGNGIYKYTLNRNGVALITQTTKIFNNISVAGDYTVTITDSNLCTFTTTPKLTIVDLNPPKGMTITTTTAATCPTNTGSVTITDVVNAANVPVPTTGLEYRIVSPTATPFQPSNVFDNIKAGITYKFEVRDANKCTYEKTHLIDLPKDFTVAGTPTSIKCFGASDGSATFTVSGMVVGTNYSYSVDTTPPTTGSGISTTDPFDITVSGLGAGLHTIAVTNSVTKCIVTEKVTVAGPASALKLNPSDLTHVTCKVLGTAKINAVGGSGTYTYTVTQKAPVAGTAINQTNDNLFKNLVAGTYSVSVTDGTGCNVVGADFTIDPEVKPTASIDATSVYCAGGSGATLKVTPNAQTNYTYSINKGTAKADGTFSGLTPGKYTIRVTDTSTGCFIDLDEEIIAIPISASTKLLADLDCDVAPASSDASIEVTILDGYPDYKYRHNTTGIFTTESYTDVAAGSNIFIFDTGASGTHYFEITDKKGCTTIVSRVINVKVKPSFTFKTADAKCNGGTGTITVTGTPATGTYEYSKDNGGTFQPSNIFAGLLKGDYEIVVRDAKKCLSDAQTVSIGEPVALSGSADVTTPLKCGPGVTAQAAIITVTIANGTPFAGLKKYRYDYGDGNGFVDSNTFSTTVVGDVTVTIKDANDCTITRTATVAPLNSPTALVITPSNSITCKTAELDADLKLDVTGGTSPFKYEITSPTASKVTVDDALNTHTFADLAVGHYFFKVTDANNCTITNDFEILPASPIYANGGIVSNVTCNNVSDGSIKFTITGNTTGGYTYTLDGSVSGTIATVPPAVADVVTYTGLNGGETYTFTVTNDGTKCKSTADVTLANPLVIKDLDATASKVYCSKVNTTIKVTASGGNSPLYFAVVKSTDTPVFPTDYNTSGIFTKDTSIDGINFIAYVTDKNGNCRQSMVVPLVKDDEPTIVSAGTICYTGTQIPVIISGTVYGGIPLYGLDGSYNIDPIKKINGPGTYILGIKDDNGCEKTTTLVVNDKLTASAEIKKELSCPIGSGATNPAEIKLSASGGNTTYTWEYKLGAAGTYSTPTLQPGSIFQAFGPGDYYFKVTSAGCSLETMVTIKEPVLPEIISADVVQSIKCNGDETAAIDVVIDYTKGIAPYTINVQRTGGPAPFNTAKDYGTQTYGLSAGNYTITVTDGKGCVVTKDIVIDQPILIDFVLTSVPITCDASSGTTLGSVTIKTITGGTIQHVDPKDPTSAITKGFTYYITNNFGDVISGNPHTADITDVTDITKNGRGDWTFPVINYGLYTLTAVDANGCSVSKQITVASPISDLDIDLTLASDCTTGGTAIIKVISPVGSHNYEFGILEYSGSPYTNNYVLADDPVNFPDIKKFTNLTPGVTYTFVVHDKTTKCYYVKSGGALSPSSPLVATVTPKNVSCKGAKDGSVKFSLSNLDPSTTNVDYAIYKAFTDIQIYPASPTMLNVSLPIAAPGTVNIVPPVGVLVPGTYYIKFIEHGGAGATYEGCKSGSVNFDIFESSIELSVSATPFKNENCNKLGVITVQAKDGTGPYMYQVTTSSTAPTVNDPGWNTVTSYDRAAGTYYIYAKDANDCIKPAATTVKVVKDAAPSATAPASVCIDALPTTVTVTGGVFTGSSISYAIGNGPLATAVPGNYQAQPTFTISAAGTYTFFVMDNNQCVAKAEYIVNSRIKADLMVQTALGCPFPTPSTPAVIHGDVSLGLGTNYSYRVKLGIGGSYSASIPLTPAGATSFDYTTPTATAGDYIFEITDGECKIEKTVTVKAIVPTVFDTDVIDVKCKTDNTGSIIVNVASADFPVEYKLDKTSSPTASYPYQPENRFDNLVAGTYTVTVRNILLCETEKTGIIVAEPVDPLVVSANFAQPTCGTNNSMQPTKIVLSALGGTSTYEYSFDGSDFSGETTYYVDNSRGNQVINYSVRDANLCTNSNSLTVVLLDPPTNFVMTPSNAITCDPAFSSTTITISGPVNKAGAIALTDLSYQIVSPASAAKDNFGNPAFAGLLPGDYIFQITDLNGCTKQLSYKIDDVVKINIVEQSTTDIGCFGIADGKASLLVTGFAGTYTYSLDGVLPALAGPADGKINLTGLASGHHTVNVFDNVTKCSKPVGFDIDAPAVALSLDPLDVTPLGCSTDGAVTITTKGGWGNNIYTLTPPSGPTVTNTDGIFGNLKLKGLYGVSVKDANGCVDTDSFTLVDPTPPIATITATSDYCYDSTNKATLVVKASSGVGPYLFSIDNGDTFLPSNSLPSDDTYTFSNLSPGSYDVFVKDAYGCQSLASVKADIKSQLFASATNDKDIFCGAVDGTIKITAVGGYGSYTYTVKNPAGVVSAQTAFPAGLDTAYYTVPAADSGNYEIVVYDAKNCSYVITNAVVMNPPTPVDLLISDIDITPVDCNAPQGTNNNGTITVNLRPVNNSDSYNYTLTPLPAGTAKMQSMNVFSGLAPGKYNVSVTSNLNCEANVDVEITDPVAVTAIASAVPFSCVVNPTKTTAVVTGGGGTGTYTFSIDGIRYFASNSVPADNKYTFELTDNGSIQNPTFYVKDSKGCIQTTTLTTALDPLPKLNSVVGVFGPDMDCLNNKQEINVTINGGSNLPNPFTYNVYKDGTLIAGPLPVTGNTFTYDALSVGSYYEFEVLDNNTKCSLKSTSYEIPVFDKVKVVASTSANVDCSGNSSGTIEINILNYSGTYDYAVYKGATAVAGASGSHDTATSNPFVIPFGLAEGNNYTVRIVETGFPSCPATSNSVIITEPAPLDLSGFKVSVKNQNCHDLKAVLTIDDTTIVGGTSGYMYTYVPTTTPPTIPGSGDYKPFTTIAIATNKIAPAFDSYDVYVRDAQGCFDHVTVNISQDPMPSITSAIPTQCPSTAGTYDIPVVATGFTVNLEYSLDGNSWGTNKVLVVKTTGNHTVYVRDENKCVVTKVVNILEPLKLLYDITANPTCNGSQGEVTLIPSGGTVTPSYEYSKDNWVSSQPTPVFSGLTPGTYTFSVRDTGTNCTKDVEVVFETPNTAIDFSLTAAKVLCNGGSTGSITVKMADQTATVNNNPVYTYAINPSPLGMVLVGNVFTNLPKGTYTVTVTSGKGCPIDKTIDVEEPLAITVPNPDVLEFGCTTINKTNDATITVGLPSGGSNDYKVYEFLKNGNPIPVQRGDNPVYIEPDLLGGNYVINVYDTNGCLGTTTATIKPFVAIDFATPSAITVTKAITCINDQDIQVNVTATGTTTPMPVLSYKVKGTSAGSIYDVTNNDGAFTGLTIGNYLVTVTNTTGCVLTMIHYVNDPNTFDLVANNVKNVVCFGSATGSVDLTIVDKETTLSDDAGAFDYTISGPVNITGNSGGATINIPNLLAGTYTVKAKLTGKPTCDVETTFLIEQPATALTLKENHTPISCDPGNDGTILAIAEGGWPGDLQYELVGPVNVAYSSQLFFEGLTPGFYTLNVKDVNGCIQTATVTLKNPDPILVTARATVNALMCNGDNSGEITVDLPTGGQGSNYSYILNYLSLNPVISSEAQTNPVFSGLAAGTYSVTVVDGLNCTSQPSAEVVISEPARVEPSLVLESRITCKTSATLTLSAIGGTGPYEYSSDQAFTTVLGRFASSTTFAVAIGDHQYYVRDSKGCIGAISNNITVNPITPLSLDLDLSDAKIYCKGSATASIDAVAIGGLGNYSYTLLDNSGGVVRLAQPTGYFDLLPQGTYIVRVDSGDCQFDSAPIVINEPAEALLVVSKVTDATCFAANDGKIAITATGGTGVIKYAISPNLGMFDDKFVFDHLAPGFYDIVVQDENSCFEVLRLEVKEPTLLGAKVVGPILQEICDGDKDGAFSVEIFGGKPPYSISLDNESGVYSPVTGTNYDFTGLKGGTHTVYIKDATCLSKVEVIMDNAVILNPTIDINYDCVNNAQTNMITVTVDQSNTDLSQVDYSLDSDVGPWQGNIFTNVAPGRHFIVARHTNGCIVQTASFDIKSYDPLSLIETPGQAELNIISVTASGGAPAYEYSFNGEPFTSSNKYKIYKSGDYKVIVRDKNGCTFEIVVPAIYVDVCLDNYFTPAGVTNTTWGPGCTNIYNNLEFSIFDRYGRVIAKYHYGQKWDGRYNGADLPSGDYWYVLKLNDAKDDREFVGHFTLYR
ncbi:T9SS type B sorting domain-containing protein [Flavobacterium sp. FlaQc-57]|uniref:T9SS type B sorting domain-containing protein n=1 Tax=Flavobacterium sp. FlaQc-57 TaxID=3374186 RepID=UPI0037569590